MKPYIQYLAEGKLQDEHSKTLVHKDRAIAAADKFAEDRMVAFAEWMNKNGIHYFKEGKWWFGTKGNFTTLELIAIFNSETN